MRSARCDEHGKNKPFPPSNNLLCLQRLAHGRRLVKSSMRGGGPHTPIGFSKREKRPHSPLFDHLLCRAYLHRSPTMSQTPFQTSS